MVIKIKRIIVYLCIHSTNIQRDLATLRNYGNEQHDPIS